jgi:fumarylpyruvate hydrolase
MWTMRSRWAVIRRAKSPFFFQKSTDCVAPPGGDFSYPGETQEVHHEIELVIALGKGELTVGVV